MDAAAKAEVEWLIKLVSAIRGKRAELNVSPAAKVPLIVWADADELDVSKIKRTEASIERLARIDEIRFTNVEVTKNPAQVVVDGVTYVLLLEGVIDIAAEKARLTKALEASTKEAKALEGRLANPAFVEKAKPEAVEKARADHAAHAAEAARLAAALDRLG